MALTLRDIISSNASSGKGFREQVETCRNPDFFAGRDIRSMAAWQGFYYQTGSETDNEMQTRYSAWTCDTPAVNGRKTRVRYTDTRTRTRPVYSNGTTGEWGEWSAWQQTAAVTEEAFDGNTCPYILRYEYRNDRANGGAYCEQSDDVNTGYLVQPRARDYCAVYSNGSTIVSSTETYDQKTYDAVTCPVKPVCRFSFDRRNKYGGWGQYDSAYFKLNHVVRMGISYSYREYENGVLVNEGTKPYQYVGVGGDFSVSVHYLRDLEITILTITPTELQDDYLFPVGYTLYSSRNR